MKKYRFFIITILLTFGISGFAYFINKSFIDNYNLIGSVWDTKIPMINEFIYFYGIWYPFEIGILYLAFKKDRSTYIKTFLALCISLFIAHVLFFVYPTTVERPIFDTYTGLTSWIVWFTYQTDIPVNCFPSIHCIICFLVIFCTISAKGINNKYKIIIYLVNTMIILSTLFVKQHVIIDVIASAVITTIVYYIICNLKLLKNIQNKLVKID